MNKIDLKSLNIVELKNEIASIGEKAFRAGQIYGWLHAKLASSFADMTNLSKELRDKLEEKYRVADLEPVEVQISKTDGTRKYLFRLEDGNVIESVLMIYKHGNSVCISTQAGCRMGCRFCASTIGGLTRNLEVSEMLGQIYTIQRLTGERVSNVVMMGTGEPLDNYENVMKTIRMLSDENGLHISQRNITMSTCGIVPGIRRLADENFQITLAISLHAADDETRKTIMPIANKYSIEEIMDACRYYFAKTGRRLTFEYSLIRGVNDTMEDAARLRTLLHGLNCHVNLIPVNPIEERDFMQTKKDQIHRFKNYLSDHGIPVTIRREMGTDIQGACGQLRKTYRDTNEK
ncbi:23S rRNA (adenine(2503)-C(2))-methyltransferase RlmN [Parasporobacterium paucivorans]|uniref:Probable dual-specificity RNA methyltransferase RlmN n=1 Tax=Parasporobacterium paucivorans DSM 15970 TaxID=1122934 RepID=A0A1M6ERW5_9FIRM|nr:23S rRNA (adenine(2503)-C(2))-methyltransferase RlmN [Parasporobacterium paucivorans]SHI88207.1 23S rRNA m(2)A-2503 methyltransferase [Parasporobacterium paucivorans DSM 15970]